MLRIRDNVSKGLRQSVVSISLQLCSRGNRIQSQPCLSSSLVMGTIKVAKYYITGSDIV